MRKFARVFKFAAVPAIALLAACGDVGSDNATLTESTGNTSASVAAAKFKVGNTVNFETFEVTVKSVEKRNSVGSQYGKQDVADGGIFVAITYTVKNTGKKAIGMFDGPTLKLIDPSGTAYEPDLGASVMFSLQKDFNSKGVSNLNPGIKVNDGKVWEVSKDQFDLATWKVILDGHEDSPISLN